MTNESVTQTGSKQRYAAAPLCIKTSRLSEIAALILFHVKTGSGAAPDEAQG